MAFTVVYDACVLYPAQLRDLLLRIAAKGLVRARWSEDILDECFSALAQNRPELSSEKLERTRALVCKAVPDCLVTSYQDLVPGLSLPDPDDRHVLAAAIRAQAQTIVTFNLRDFPAERLAPYNVEAQHPDDFVLYQVDLNEGVVLSALQEQVKALKNPPRPVEHVLDSLRRSGIVQSVARLRGLLGDELA